MNGQTFDLVENWDEQVAPDHQWQKPRGKTAADLPYWQELKAKYEAQGEWLRPYSFRDTFSVRSHDLEIETTLMRSHGTQHGSASPQLQHVTKRS